MQLYLLLISCFVARVASAAENIPFSSVIRPREIGIMRDSQTMHIYGLKTNIAILVALQNSAGETVVALNNEASVASVEKMLQVFSDRIDKSQWKNLQCAIIAPGNMKKVGRKGKWVNEFDVEAFKLIRYLKAAVRKGIPKGVASHSKLYPYIPSTKDPVIYNGGRFGRYTMPEVKVVKTEQGDIEWSYRGDGHCKHLLLGR